MRASRLDNVGAFVSGTCAVHCIAMSAAPVLFAGLGVMHSERTEWALAGTAVVFGLLSAMVAMRAHRPRWLLFLFAAGLGLLVAGRFLEHVLETSAVAITGGAVLITAHLFHLRLAKSCEQNACDQASCDQDPCERVYDDPQAPSPDGDLSLLETE